MRLINDVEDELRSKPEFKTHREEVMSQTFRDDFLPKIQKLNDGLKIVKDNDFASAILNLLKEIEK